MVRLIYLFYVQRTRKAIEESERLAEFIDRLECLLSCCSCI